MGKSLSVEFYSQLPSQVHCVNDTAAAINCSTTCTTTPPHKPRAGAKPGK